MTRSRKEFHTLVGPCIARASKFLLGKVYGKGKFNALNGNGLDGFT